MKGLLKVLLKLLLCWTPNPQHPSIELGAMALRWRWGWIKGKVYLVWYSLLYSLGLGPKITWGKRVSVQGSLDARGPGSILVGDDVIMNDRVTPYTHSRKAAISIGRASYLNGTRLGCFQSIEIGESCILADVRIMDSDMHPLRGDRFRSQDIAVAPVRIGNGVWLAAQTAVLKGATIGDRSVLSFGSVLLSDLPEDSLGAGNPAQVVKKLS